MLTPEQLIILGNWIGTQDTRATSELLRRLYERPIVGTTPSNIVQVPRDKWLVQQEAVLIQIAEAAGIAQDDKARPGIINAKLEAWIAAATTAKKPVTTYRAAFFWTAYNNLREEAVTGNDNDDAETGLQPIYGDAPATTLGLPADVRGGDIEQAQR